MALSHEILHIETLCLMYNITEWNMLLNNHPSVTNAHSPPIKTKHLSHTKPITYGLAASSINSHHHYEELFYTHNSMWLKHVVCMCSVMRYKHVSCYAWKGTYEIISVQRVFSNICITSNCGINYLSLF